MGFMSILLAERLLADEGLRWRPHRAPSRPENQIYISKATVVFALCPCRRKPTGDQPELGHVF